MKWKVVFKTSRKTVGGTTYIVLVQTLNHAQSINQSIKTSRQNGQSDSRLPVSVVQQVGDRLADCYKEVAVSIKQ